jgi:hypothetical protein
MNETAFETAAGGRDAESGGKGRETGRLMAASGGKFTNAFPDLRIALYDP